MACVCVLLLSKFSFGSEQQPIDLIVVIDTSASMHHSYSTVREYMIGPILQKFLRIGDTFHLISFSSAPRTEIFRRIEGLGDVETIIARMLFMYPLDPFSDVIAALDYVSRYPSDLPDIRPKTVVFISDGEHYPPPTSPFAHLGLKDVQARLIEVSTRLSGHGWTFHFLRVPFEGDPLPKLSMNSKTPISEAPVKTKSDKENSTKTAKTSSKLKQPPPNPEEIRPMTVYRQEPPADTTLITKIGSEEEKKNSTDSTESVDVTDAVSQLLSVPVTTWDPKDSTLAATLIGSVSAAFPQDIGKTSRSISIPLKLKNPSSESIYLETKEILVDGIDKMLHKTFATLKPRSEATLKLAVELPTTQVLGPTTLHIEPVFAAPVRISPESGTIAAEIIDVPLSQFLKASLPIFLFVLGLIAALFLIFLGFIFLRRIAIPRSIAAGSVYVPLPLSFTRRHSAPEVSTHAPVVLQEEEVATLQREKDSAILDDYIAKQSTKTVQTTETQASRASTGFTPLPSMGNSQGEKIRKETDSDISLKQKGTNKTVRLNKENLVKSTQLHYEKTIKEHNNRIMLSLFVEDQNTAIGKRNIHLIRPGRTLSVGGGRSDFLIFLVPLPAKIAELYFDGETCTFIPHKAEFFPDIKNSFVENCIDKTIHIISSKGYGMHIRFERFKDPLISLNTFLHSIHPPQ